MKTKTAFNRSILTCFVALSALLSGSLEAGAITDHTWTGNGPDGRWSRPGNWENNSPPPANSHVNLYFPAGRPKKASVNDRPGLTVHNLVVNDFGMSFSGPGLLNTLKLDGTVRLETASLTFLSNLEINLVGDTTVELRSDLVGVGTWSESSITFESKILGAGAFTVEGDATAPKDRAGDAFFTAKASNTYLGATVFEKGVQVRLDNYDVIPAPAPWFFWEIGAVSVPTDLTIKTGADVRLDGREQIGNTADVLVLENSRLNLWRNSDTIGSFTCSGRLQMEFLNVSNYGRLIVNGAVTITDHAEGSWGGFTSDQLYMTSAAGFVPPNNSIFTIIENNGFDAATEPFFGWNEGDGLNLGGKPFHLSYTGGTGNDLTVENP
jgi:hypothetical protein